VKDTSPENEVGGRVRESSGDDVDVQLPDAGHRGLNREGLVDDRFAIGAEAGVVRVVHGGQEARGRGNDQGAASPACGTSSLRAASGGLFTGETVTVTVAVDSSPSASWIEYVNVSVP
jgi:hypothetical protein